MPTWYINLAISAERLRVNRQNGPVSEERSCFSLYLGVLFYVISFEVSGALCRPSSRKGTPGSIHEGVNCHYDKLSPQCGGGNIGLIHLVVALADPTVCESFVRLEQTGPF